MFNGKTHVKQCKHEFKCMFLSQTHYTHTFFVHQRQLYALACRDLGICFGCIEINTSIALMHPFNLEKAHTIT